MENLEGKTFLISLFDKEPYFELVKKLANESGSIIASSGTARWLDSRGINCRSVEEVFGLSERLEGKVKTLQPDIYTAIMADSAAEIEGDYPLIEGVCIDLTPAGEAGDNTENFEKIDIGGVGLLRAAAKSWRGVTVVSSPHQADYLLENLPPDEKTRRHLAGQTVKNTLKYDKQFLSLLKPERVSELAERLALSPRERLRYGENPAQSGFIGGDVFSEEELPFEQLGGAGLSYTNCLDLDSARRLVSDTEEARSVVIKHTNPTGWGKAQDEVEAFERAWSGDPKSAYGGFAALNKKVEEEVARSLVDKFLEGVVAPEFSPAALEVLQERERLRIISWPGMFADTPPELIRNFASEFYLCQDELTEEDYNSGWEVVTSRQPDAREEEALRQAWNICRHVTSNAAVLGGENKIYGVGAGQQSRVDAVELAVKKYRQFHKGAASPVLASDGFFPFPDNIEVAARAGVEAVVAPGGSIRDDEVIEEANKNDMVLIFADERIFYH